MDADIYYLLQTGITIDLWSPGLQLGIPRGQMPLLQRLVPSPIGTEPMNLPIIRALDRPCMAPLKGDPSLEEAVAAIRATTKGPDLPNGIPIHVDPMGLNEAEHTITQRVTMDLEPGDCSLAAVLPMLLKQLDLDYFVKDGVLHISHCSSVDQPFVGTFPDPFQCAAHSLVALLAAWIGAGAAHLVYDPNME